MEQRSSSNNAQVRLEDRDIINDPQHRQEMIQKTNQMLQPCVEIDGKILIDVSGEEVEAYLLSNSLVGTTAKEADAPTDQACENEAETAHIQFQKDYVPK